MATSQFYIYSPDALPYDPGSGTFTFAADYDFTQDRVLVTVNDDDQFMDGDEKADEFGEDANQTGSAAKPDGTPITSGNIYTESFAVIQAPDGTQIWIDRIEIEGQLIGYSPSQELEPGVAYTFLSETDVDNAPGGNFDNDNRLTYSQYEAQSVPCFVSGTMLLTRDGMMPIDWVSVGDDLWTQDNGWQVVRWRGLRQFGGDPYLPRPIEIQPGALGPDTPAEVTRISPQHRVLLAGPACALLFGVDEVFVAAKHLLHWPGVAEVALDADYAYHHLLFDRHEVLTASNIALESLLLGEQTSILSPSPPRQLARSLAAGHAQTTRLCLTGREARALKPGSFPAALVRPGDVADTVEASPHLAVA